MDRRNFLKTTGTVIAGATIARSALANAAADANAPAGRLVVASALARAARPQLLSAPLVPPPSRGPPVSRL